MVDSQQPDPRPGFIGRQWVIDRLDDWLKRDARSFLITGAPGTGKSELASHLNDLSASGPTSQHSKLRPGFLTHFHGCSASDPRTLNPSRFTENLVHSLTVRIPGFRTALTDSLSLNGDSIKVDVRVGNVEGGGRVIGVEQHIHIDEVDVHSAFDRTVVRPLEQLAAANNASPVVVLIDALDEGLLSKTRKSIPELLAVYLPILPPNVRFVLTTRPDPRISRLFDTQAIDLVADAPTGTDDVLTFAELWLKKAFAGMSDTSTALTLAKHLATRADGNFLYAYYVLLDLSTRVAELARLTEDAIKTIDLPLDLVDIYRRFLDRELGTSECWSSLYRPLLGLLAVTQADGLTRDELLGSVASLTGTRVAESIFADSLRHCAQFLRERASEPGLRLSLYHHSFNEFLVQEHGPLNVYVREAESALSEYLADIYTCARESFTASARARISREENWLASLPYIRVHWITHLVHVGRLDEFLCDPLFLLGVQPDPAQFDLSTLSFDSSQMFRSYMDVRDTIRATGGPHTQLAYLALANMRNGNGLLGPFQSILGRSEWRPVWSHWEMADWKTVLVRVGEPVTSLVSLGSRSMLAVGTAHGRLVIIDTSSGNVLESIQVSRRRVDVHVAPGLLTEDGPLIAARLDTEVVVLEGVPLRVRAVLTLTEFGSGYPTAVAVCQAAGIRYFIVGTSDGDLQVWQCGADGCTRQGSAHCHDGRINAIAVQGNREKVEIWSGDDAGIVRESLWIESRLTTTVLAATATRVSAVTIVEATGDDPIIVVGLTPDPMSGPRHTLLAWRVNDAKPSTPLFSVTVGSVYALCALPASLGNGVAVATTGEIRFVSMDGHIVGKLRGHERTITGLAVEREHLLSAGDSDVLYMWFKEIGDTDTPRGRRGVSRVNALVANRNHGEPLLAIGNDDASVELRRATSGALVTEPFMPTLGVFPGQGDSLRDRTDRAQWIIAKMDLTPYSIALEELSGSDLVGLAGCGNGLVRVISSRRRCWIEKTVDLRDAFDDLPPDITSGIYGITIAPAPVRSLLGVSERILLCAATVERDVLIFTIDTASWAVRPCGFIRSLVATAKNIVKPVAMAALDDIAVFVIGDLDVLRCEPVAAHVKVEFRHTALRRLVDTLLWRRPTVTRKSCWEGVAYKTSGVIRAIDVCSSGAVVYCLVGTENGTCECVNLVSGRSVGDPVVIDGSHWVKAVAFMDVQEVGVVAACAVGSRIAVRTFGQPSRNHVISADVEIGSEVSSLSALGSMLFVGSAKGLTCIEIRPEPASLPRRAGRPSGTMS
jgi:hypothetical protein